ncbi:hypothetical protein V2H45_12195 [Tumidithrix elongata RA019]|uniref:Uncharacterized protein n=2 Tax=Tumidithrix TaxID=3088355 RepID=A0AAW9PSV9_9CYAN|nr:hypothetical protein [Tumidithrix elongata RA019]
MSGQQQDSMKFLTMEEAYAIDGAMLSTMEKFMTRIAISSLRVLAHIAQAYGIPGEALQPSQIVQWIEQDSQIRREKGKDAAFLNWAKEEEELDFADDRNDEVTGAALSSDEKFLTRMTISAMQVLIPIAKDYGVSMEALTVSQIIAWVEKDAKLKREQGQEAGFLQW